MSKEVLVTSYEFDKLKNPYTGLTMRVMMVVTDRGDPLFHAAPTEYSPTQVQPTSHECYEKWNRVNGVSGMKNGQEIRCAYTGETLSIVHTDGGVRYDGGFNPHMLYPRDEFLYRASMRGGVSKYPKPRSVQRVVYVREDGMPESRKSKDRGGDLSGDAVEMAAASMQKHSSVFDRPATVHISKSPAKGRKQKK